MVWKIQSLRRIFVALPFLAAAIVGFASLASLQYAETFGLSEVGAGARDGAGPARRGRRPHLRRTAGRAAPRPGPEQGLRPPGVGSGRRRRARRGVRLGAVARRSRSSLHALLVTALAIVGPGVLTALSLGIPPRARAIGFSIGALFVLPGLIAIPLVGTIGDHVRLPLGPDAHAADLPDRRPGHLPGRQGHRRGREERLDRHHGPRRDDAGAGRGSARAAERPRAGRRLRRRAGAVRGRLQRRRRARSSPCSAPTAPASRRC